MLVLAGLAGLHGWRPVDCSQDTTGSTEVEDSSTLERELERLLGGTQAAGGQGKLVVRTKAEAGGSRKPADKVLGEVAGGERASVGQIGHHRDEGCRQRPQGGCGTAVGILVVPS